MKPPIALAIRSRAMPLVINLPCNALIVRNIIAKIVLVNEIFSRVVGWINKTLSWIPRLYVLIARKPCCFRAFLRSGVENGRAFPALNRYAVAAAVAKSDTPSLLSLKSTANAKRYKNR